MIWTGKFDGKDDPVTGDPNSDTRSLTKIDDRTLGPARRGFKKPLRFERSVPGEYDSAIIVKALVPAIARRRGNPNWGKPGSGRTVLTTEFEEQVHLLGLVTQPWADSTQLRKWCERNRNRCYIPEWLLSAWGIEVDPTFSGEARVRRK
jgi:hypothetical protein